MERPALRTDQKGFTLVEVMVALILLLIMSLGTLAGLHKTFHHLYQNRYMEEAKAVSRMVMEETRNTPFDDLSNGSDSGKQIRFFGSSNKTFHWKRTITDVPGHTDEGKVCKVAVSWNIIQDGSTYWYNATSIRGDL